MQIAIVNNEQVVQIGDSSDLFPNVSFPTSGIDVEFLAENSAMEVVVWEQFDLITEKQERTDPYIKDGKVYTCLTRVKTEAELQEDQTKELLAKETQVRNQRNQLLKDSDWTQVLDAPVDKPAWATYRQALRDVTAQEGFPFNVTFPNPPL